MTDFRGDPEIPENSPFYGTVAGRVSGGGVLEQEDGSLIAEIPVNPALLHAEGTIVVIPVR